MKEDELQEDFERLRGLTDAELVDCYLVRKAKVTHQEHLLDESEELLDVALHVLLFRIEARSHPDLRLIP